MEKQNKERLEEMAMSYMETAFSAGYDEDGHDLGRGDFDKGTKIIEKLKDFEEMEAEAENRAERIQADRERNESQERIEENKQKLPKDRKIIEIAKIAAPFALGLLQTGLFVFMTKETMNVEVNGYTKNKSTQMTQNQTPKLFNNLRF